MEQLKEPGNLFTPRPGDTLKHEGRAYRVEEIQMESDTICGRDAEGQAVLESLSQFRSALERKAASVVMGNGKI